MRNAVLKCILFCLLCGGFSATFASTPMPVPVPKLSQF